jgi:hypothetical protein
MSNMLFGSVFNLVRPSLITLRSTRQEISPNVVSCALFYLLPSILAQISGFDTKLRFRGKSFQDIVVVTMRAVFIFFFVIPINANRERPCIQVLSNVTYFMFFLKGFLHFLQANTISSVLRKGWSDTSWWHSAQSNHLLQQGARIATYVDRLVNSFPYTIIHTTAYLDIQYMLAHCCWV